MAYIILISESDNPKTIMHSWILHRDSETNAVYENKEDALKDIEWFKNSKSVQSGWYKYYQILEVSKDFNKF